MGFMNGLYWFSVCGPPWTCGTFASVVVARRKIPWMHPGVELEQLEFDLINIWEKNMPFQPVFSFLDEMIKYHSKRFLCQLSKKTHI